VVILSPGDYNLLSPDNHKYYTAHMEYDMDRAPTGLNNYSLTIKDEKIKLLDIIKMTNKNAYEGNFPTYVYNSFPDYIQKYFTSKEITDEYNPNYKITVYNLNIDNQVFIQEIRNKLLKLENEFKDILPKIKKEVETKKAIANAAVQIGKPRAWSNIDH